MITTLCRIKPKPLARVEILKVVRQKLGNDFSETDQLPDEIAWALDKRTEPLDFVRGKEVFTVCCGCIITT
jgi:hypothetical protein